MIISLKRAGFGSIKIAEFRHFLLKCLYQARKVTGHVYLFVVSILRLYTIFQLDFGTVAKVWYFSFSILIIMHWIITPHMMIIWFGQKYLYVKSLKKNEKKLVQSFNFTFSYIDDVLSLNNSRFGDFVLDMNIAEIILTWR